MGILSRRQLSRMDRIAATFGPACWLPRWIQFFRPTTSGRMEFSARLLLSSSSGWSRKRVSFGHSANVYWAADVICQFDYLGTHRWSRAEDQEADRGKSP